MLKKVMTSLLSLLMVITLVPASVVSVSAATNPEELSPNVDTTKYNYLKIDQAKMKETAVGSTEETDTTYQEGPASQAFDGNIANAWHTEYNHSTTTKPHWLRWSLGGNFTVGRLEYQTKKLNFGDECNGRWKNVRILVTTAETIDDQTQWTTVYSGRTPDVVDGKITFNFEPTNATAMKVEIYEAGHDRNSTPESYASAGEINVYKTRAISTEVNITAKVNGVEVTTNGASLEDMIANANLTADDVKELELVSGKVTQDDLKYIETLSYLTHFTLNVSDTMQLIGKNGNPTTVLGEGEAEAQLKFAPKTNGSSSSNIEYLTLGGITEVKKNGIKNPDSYMTKIDMPDCVNVGDWAFAFSYASTILLPKAKTIGSLAFTECHNLDYLELPAVEIIADRAFEDTENLTNLTIGPNVKEIGNLEFALINRNHIKHNVNVTIKATTPPKMNLDAFNGCDARSTFTVPQGSLKAYMAVLHPEAKDKDVYSKDEVLFSANTGMKLMEDDSTRVAYNVNGKGHLVQYAYVPFGEAVGNRYPTEIADDNLLPGNWVDSNGKEVTRETIISTVEDKISQVEYTTDGVEAATLYFYDGSHLDSKVKIRTGLKFSDAAMVSDPVKLGFIFKGWFTEENGKGTQFNKDMIVGKENIVYKAYFVEDKTAPTVEVAYTNNAQGGVTVTLTSNEAMQAMEGWSLSPDGKTATKDFSADYTGKVLVTDLAGNVTEKELKVVIPDTTAPEVSISYKEKDAKTVTATITSNEPMSEVFDVTRATGWTLSADKLTATKDFTTDYTGKVSVKDLAGNTTELDVKVVIPDKTAPTVKVDVGYSPEKKAAMVVITTDEVCKQPEGWTLPSPGGKAFNKEFTKNGTYTVEVEDLAGNKTTVSFKITDIKEEVKPTPTPQPTDKPTKPESTVKPTVKPEPTKKPVANGNGGYDDGGPFTTDKCGSVYDRWGNLMWKAPACNAQADDGYTIVNTSDK